VAHWTALPRPIRLYLEAEGIATRRLTFLLVDGSGTVTDCGGDVAMLAPRQIEIGVPAAKQLAGLSGLLPAGQKPTEIPHCQLEPGLVVHLHVFSTEDGDAVVMVDATPEHEPKRRRLQLRYDRKLASRRNPSR
jgi:hypothetical protein